MKKCVVITTGNFGLLSPLKEVIHAHGALTCVFDSPFIRTKLSDGSLELVAKNLPEEATDADLQQCVKESENNLPLALEAFCSLYGVDLEGNPTDTELKKADKGSFDGKKNSTVLKTQE